MKKIFSIFLFVLCAISVNAQKGKSAGKGGAVNNLSIGPIVGVNFSTLRGNDDSKFKAGFSGGIFANYSILENLGVTAQVLYSTQGAKSKRNTDFTQKVNYFQIPVLIMYYFNKPGSTFRPKVMLGPQFGFLSAAKLTTGSTTVDVKDNYTDTDLSGVISLGFNYRVGKGMWLNVDARYAHGFENISKDANLSGVGLPVSPKANNSVISIMAGLSFAFGNYEDL